VVHKLSKGGPSRASNTVATISIQATTPREFARTGEAVERVLIDPGDLNSDAEGVAPLAIKEFKRRATPP
jgi:hypothetical protein